MSIASSSNASCPLDRDLTKCCKYFSQGVSRTIAVLTSNLCSIEVEIKDFKQINLVFRSAFTFGKNTVDAKGAIFKESSDAGDNWIMSQHTQKSWAMPWLPMAVE